MTGDRGTNLHIGLDIELFLPKKVLRSQLMYNSRYFCERMTGGGATRLNSNSGNQALNHLKSLVAQEDKEWFSTD
jgi:hypothetical protein